jgi:hypothetical protein
MGVGLGVPLRPAQVQVTGLRMGVPPIFFADQHRMGGSVPRGFWHRTRKPAVILWVGMGQGSAGVALIRTETSIL